MAVRVVRVEEVETATVAVTAVEREVRAVEAREAAETAVEERELRAEVARAAEPGARWRQAPRRGRCARRCSSGFPTPVLKLANFEDGVLKGP